LAALAAWGAPAAKAPSDPAAKSPTDSPSDTSAHRGGVAHTSEAFWLPDDWRNDDGTFNQASIVAQQKKRVDVINKELKIQMKVTETKHYLIFSNAGDAVTKTFQVGCEALYTNLHRQVNIPLDAPVWDGKCILLLFATEAQYKDYRKIIDGSTMPSEAVAYFLWEKLVHANKDPVGFPQLMHICIPLGNTKPQMLQRSFSHEGTHAFFCLYHKAADMPLWLDEGLAEYMTIVNDPSLRPDLIYFAKEYKGSMKSVFDDKAHTLTAEQYPVVATMVECMLTQGGPKLKQLIEHTKDGMTSDQALKAVYGMDTAGLEKTWREYVTRQAAALHLK
jgi:hypothetical protein